MLVNSETLARLHKHVCSHEPGHNQQVIGGSGQVDFMLGSKLCSRKSTNIAFLVFPIRHVTLRIFVMIVQSISDDLITSATKACKFAPARCSLNLGFSEKDLNVI